MPRVALEELQPGYHLAGNVYNQNGAVLLTAGMRLRESYIRRLRDLGVRAVDVQPARFRDVRPRDILTPELRTRAALAMAQVLSGIQKGNVDIAPIHPFVAQIVRRVEDNHHVLLGLTDIRAHDAYTHAHSVNVCMLSTLIGRAMGFSRTDLTALATAAILHDLGRVFLDRKVLDKQGPLTPEEFEQVKQHTQLGYDLLASHPRLDTRVPPVLLHHHERSDGSGYPGGLTGNQTTLFARIVAVADLYDAVSSDRPYRPAMAPVECIMMLRTFERGRLWDRGAEALADQVAPYPEACTVRLATGELAIVRHCYKAAPWKPQVTVFTDMDGEPLARPWELSLLKHPEFEVADIVDMEAMPEALRLEAGPGTLSGPPPGDGF